MKKMDFTSYQINYPLHAAIRIGDQYWAQSLVAHGADINLQDCDGFTPLDLTALTGSTPIASFLLAQPGMEVNLQAWYLPIYAPYELALQADHYDIATLIVSHPTFNGDAAALNAIRYGEDLAYQFLEENHVEKPYADAWVCMKLTGHRYDLEGTLDVSAPYYDELRFEGLENNLTTTEIYHSLEAFVASQPENLVFQSVAVDMLLDTYLTANDVTKTPEERYITYTSINEQGGNNTVLIPSGWQEHSVCVVLHDTKLFICNRGYGSDGVHGIVEYEITYQENIAPDFIDMLFDPSLQSQSYIMGDIYSELGLVEVNSFEMPMQVVGNCAWTSTSAGIYATLISEYEDYGYSPDESAYMAYDFYQQWVDFDYGYGLDSVIQQHELLAQMDVYDCLLEDIVIHHHNSTSAAEVQMALTILLELEEPESAFIKMEDPFFVQAVQHDVAKYVDCYENSNILIDYPYFFINGVLYYVNLNYTNVTFNDYAKDVAMGNAWDDCLSEHTNLFSDSTLKPEDVFQTQDDLFSNTPIGSEPGYIPSHEPNYDPMIHSDILHDFFEQPLVV